MYKVRRWSTRHVRVLEKLYSHFEKLLILLHPTFRRLGYQRLEGPFVVIERLVKEFLFDSKMCGSCTLRSTGMTCPMNCPKNMRNGPCGGVRQNGNCEIEPDMPCVWKDAFAGSQLMDHSVRIMELQAPLDHRLENSSSWLREVRRKVGIEQE